MLLERQPQLQAQMPHATHRLLVNEPAVGAPRLGQRIHLRRFKANKTAQRSAHKFRGSAASSNGSGPSFSTNEIKEELPRTDGNERSLDDRILSGEVSPILMQSRKS